MMDVKGTDAEHNMAIDRITQQRCALHPFLDTRNLEFDTWDVFEIVFGTWFNRSMRGEMGT